MVATVPIATAGYRHAKRKRKAAGTNGQRANHEQDDEAVTDDVFSNDVFANDLSDDRYRDFHAEATRPATVSTISRSKLAPITRETVMQTFADPHTEPKCAASRHPFGMAWLVAWLAFGAGLLIHGLGGRPGDLDQPAFAATGQSAVLQLTKPIEQIRVGERVALAENPAEPFDDSLGNEVDPATWRQIELRLDGQSDQRFDVVLLRPTWWLDARLKNNDRQLTLSVPEVGLSGDMDVVAIKPCPTIEPVRGRVVIGTFAHQAPETVEVHLESLTEPIRSTPNHATWSHDRQRFVEAQDLQPGERVQGTKQLHRVVRIAHLSAPINVYNLEIHGQHVYQVSTLGVLVHNAGPGGSGARFIVDENGNTVDTHATPPGSYDQPGGGRTDILQREDHGAGFTHTHDPIFNTNPTTGQVFPAGQSQPGRPVTFEEVQNIIDGTAPRSSPKGR